MDAYGLGKSIYNVEVLDENRFFIRKPKLYDLTFEKPTADKEERTYSLIQKYRTKRINEYKMSVSRKENISMSYKVDMYFGERNYAKITLFLLYRMAQTQLMTSRIFMELIF